MSQSTDEMHSWSSSFWVQLDILFILPFSLTLFQILTLVDESLRDLEIILDLHQ